MALLSLTPSTRRQRRGGAVIYVITVFVGRCSGRALSFLCPTIPSYQTRLTSYQPAKACEAGPGTKNDFISVYGRPAAAQLFERNAVVVSSDSTRVERLVESPIHQIEPTLKGGPQARGSTKEKVSALRNFLGLAVKERARHSFLHSYS
ncbi:hypothetical protein RJ641_011845 [Dillenia turbinata]|uniref:Uncharacterized protein n=1 Tax=Dillenia turbinata TaxID=194707 RepID=A0AAN8V4P8_9MAGN